MTRLPPAIENHRVVGARPWRRAAWRRGLWCYGLFTLILVVLLLFLIGPIALTVGGGFVDEATGAFTTKYFLAEGFGVLRDPQYQQGLINALLIATCTTVICLTVTLPMALIAARYDFFGKTAITSLVLVPLILPPFVGAIGVQAILGRFGMVNSLLGRLGFIDPAGPGIDFFGGALGGRFVPVVIMEALHLYPILYLNTVAALSNLDPSLDEAARNLGAGRWTRFWRCTLPLIVPGIFAGATIVFIWSFTELGTPLMFEFKTVTPVQVFYGLTDIESNPRPFALVVVMLVVAVACYVLGKWALGGRAYAMQNKATAATYTPRLRGWRGLVAFGFFAAVIALAVLPHLGVVLSSVAADGTWYRSVLPGRFTADHYLNALTHELALPSILNSLVYAGLAVILCVAMGLAISYLNVRTKIRGGGLLDTLAMLPLAVPGLVMAFGYVALSLWIQRHAAGTWFESAAGWVAVRGQNPNPLVLLVIAYTIRRLPYIVRAASAGLEQTSGDLEEASRNLGAGPATTVRRVVVPLILANLIAGAVLVFSFAMLEVSDSLILASKQEHYPITKAIWELFNRLGDGPAIASAMGVWAMVLLTVTLVGASVMMGKKLGAIFRV